MMPPDYCIYEFLSSDAECGVAVANRSMVLSGRPGRHLVTDSYNDRESFSEYVSKSICNMHFLSFACVKGRSSPNSIFFLVSLD